MTNEAMDAVRRIEISSRAHAVKDALGDNDLKLLKELTRGMPKNQKD